MKIEYAHTIHSPKRVTEHRRLNLGFIRINLKDITYTREELNYVCFYGVKIKSSKPVPYWNNGKESHWLTDVCKRLNAARSNPPDLKLVGGHMPTGRPTDYNGSILEKSNAYLKSYTEEGDVIPSIAGLACVLKISRTTIYDWAKQEDKKEFSDTVKRINAEQKKVLINKGLDGKFNASITKLLLGANHSVIEKTQQELSGPDGGPISFNRIERVIVDPDSKD